MERNQFYFVLLLAISLFSCGKKTAKERAIDLVKNSHQNTDATLNFDAAELDSLYNISPQAYADSVQKAKILDLQLAELEGQIEHLPQSASDSVGRISAALTKQRYGLLDLEKEKPKFIGWKLVGVTEQGSESKILSFNFDKAITKLLK
ncbi:hypothetical protein [Pedobacter sp. UYP30]|uniref:hypothetical protein n=1 Tax=Pedobacter sp. UYP30 TaxID=1756400 RepID=UPI003396E1F0